MKLFGHDDVGTPNAVELLVSRVRKKLESEDVEIVTHRGAGYAAQQGRCGELMARLSIERRLLITTACLFLVIGSVLALTVRAYARRAADEAFDRVLTASALSIADTVAIDGGTVAVDIPYSAFAILGTSRLNRVFYRITAPDGSLTTGSPTLGLDIPATQNETLHLHDAVYRGEPVYCRRGQRYRADTVTGTGGWIGIQGG